MGTFTPSATARGNEREIVRQWHIIDAKDQVLGRVASVAARLLQGKHKATWAPFIDSGDHVVIVNAAAVKLTGKKAIVTGGSEGIGKAIAVQLAKDGFQIIVHYMGDQQGAQDTLDTIEQHGGSGRLIQFDISDRADCREKLEADIAEHGAYYGVVNNAGITKDTAFPAMTEEEWDGVIHIGPIHIETSPEYEDYE